MRLSVRLLVSVGIAFYAVAVPVLEVNASHVFNPAWVPHTRIHEVWQLLTNTSLGLFAAWRLWRHHDLRTATALNAAVMLSFLTAYALRDTYGGSMIVEGRGELRLLGMNIAVLGYGAALVGNAVALGLHRSSGEATPPAR
ncbi:MAG: hypothetical protein HYV95_15570 [Opitutae bacterium]|nr:hypothetical protein [Opitutae bacterium]